MKKDEAPPMETPTTALGAIHVSALTPEQQQQRAMALATVSDQSEASRWWALVERMVDSPAALKEMVELKNKMDDRAAALEFAGAMREFQKRCPAIPKSSTAKIATRAGGGYEYTFADFEQIVEIVRPILSDLGLSFTFDAEVTANGGMLTCTCWLRHVNGHSVASKFVVPTDTASAMSSQQKMAAAMTFAKRNALMAALGLSLTEAPDFDGGDPSQQELISEEQVATLSALREEVKANGPKFLAWLGVASLGELPASRYKEAVAALEAMRRKA